MIEKNPVKEYRTPIHVDEDEATQAFLMIDSFIDSSIEDRSVLMDKIMENRKLYDSAQPVSNFRWEGQCELVVPMLKTSRNAMEAQLMRAVFGNDPVLTVDGRGETKKPFAESIQTFLQQEITETMGMEEVMETVMKSALDDGTAGMYVCWERLMGRKTRWDTGEDAVVEDDYQRKANAKKEIISDSPVVSLLTIENFGTIPSVDGDVQRSFGLWIKKNVTGNELLQGVEVGIYDKDAVKKLSEQYRTPETESKKSNDEEQAGINQQPTNDPFNFLANPYDIYEVYFHYNPKNAEDTAAEDWVMVMHKPTNIVLSFRPNQWWHGQRPVVVIKPQLSKHGIISDSLADLAGDFQQAQTFLLRLTLDSMSLGLMPEEFIDARLGDDKLQRIQDRANRGPGKVVPIPNLKEFLELYTQRITGFAPTMAQGLQVYLDTKAQLMVGESFTEMGAKSGGNTTAREVERMIASGQEIKAQMTQRITREIDKLGAMIASLYYQHQGSEFVKKRWDIACAERYAIPIEMAFDQMEYMKIFCTGGGTTTASKERYNQSVQEIYQLIGSPLVAQNPKYVYNLTYDLIKSKGLTPERYIGTEEESIEMFKRQQEQAAAALAQSQGVVPPGASGADMSEFDLSGGEGGPGSAPLPEGVTPPPPETVNDPEHRSGPNVEEGI